MRIDTRNAEPLPTIIAAAPASCFALTDRHGQPFAGGRREIAHAFQSDEAGQRAGRHGVGARIGSRIGAGGGGSVMPRMRPGSRPCGAAATHCAHGRITRCLRVADRELDRGSPNLSERSIAP
jgi:hypothetical protein